MTNLPATPAMARKLIPILRASEVDIPKELSILAGQTDVPDSPWGNVPQRGIDDPSILSAAQYARDWGRSILYGDERIRLAALLSRADRDGILIIAHPSSMSAWWDVATSLSPDDVTIWDSREKPRRRRVCLSPMTTAMGEDPHQVFHTRTIITDCFRNDIPAMRDYCAETRDVILLVYDGQISPTTHSPLLSNLYNPGQALEVGQSLLRSGLPDRMLTTSHKEHLAMMGINGDLSSIPDSDDPLISPLGRDGKRGAILPYQTGGDTPIPSVRASYGVWEAFWKDTIGEEESTLVLSGMTEIHRRAFIHTTQREIARQYGNRAVGDCRLIPPHLWPSITAIALPHPPTTIREMREVRALCRERKWLLYDETPTGRETSLWWKALLNFDPLDEGR